MIIDKEFKKVLDELTDGQPITISLEGSDISVCFVDEDSKLSLTTSVYHGSNYIPMSVRQSVSQSSIKIHTMRTFLTIDEQKFQVFLNYLGQANALSHYNFRNILEEFGLIAEKWRLHLDERDKNDLIYVKK